MRWRRPKVAPMKIELRDEHPTRMMPMAWDGVPEDEKKPDTGGDERAPPRNLIELRGETGRWRKARGRSRGSRRSLP